MALQSRTTAVGNLQDDTSGNNYAVNKAVYVLKLDKTLAQIYSDVDSNFNGTTPITQDGVNNVTNSRGEFTYWVEAGDYIERVGANERRVSITGADYFNNRIEETENAIIDAVAGRGAYYPVGSFEAGFTYTDINQVGTFGTAPNITYYVYTGGLINLNHPVPAGTDPTSSGLYQQVIYGRDSFLSVDDMIASQGLANGNYIYTSDYYGDGYGGGGKYKIEVGNDADGWVDHNLGNNLKAVLQIGNEIDVKQAGCKCWSDRKVDFDNKAPFLALMNKIAPSATDQDIPIVKVIFGGGIWQFSATRFSPKNGAVIKGSGGWSWIKSNSTYITCLNDNQDYVWKIGGLDDPTISPMQQGFDEDAWVGKYQANGNVLEGITFSTMHPSALSNPYSYDTIYSTVYSALYLDFFNGGELKDIRFMHFDGTGLTTRDVWETEMDIMFRDGGDKDKAKFVNEENSLLNGQIYGNVSAIKVNNFMCESVNGDWFLNKSTRFINVHFDLIQGEFSPCNRAGTDGVGSSFYDIDPSSIPTYTSWSVIKNMGSINQVTVDSINVQKVSSKIVEFADTSKYILDTLMSGGYNNINISNIVFDPDMKIDPVLIRSTSSNQRALLTVGSITGTAENNVITKYPIVDVEAGNVNLISIPKLDIAKKFPVYEGQVFAADVMTTGYNRTITDKTALNPRKLVIGKWTNSIEDELFRIVRPVNYNQAEAVTVRFKAPNGQEYRLVANIKYEGADQFMIVEGTGTGDWEEALFLQERRYADDGLWIFKDESTLDGVLFDCVTFELKSFTQRPTSATHKTNMFIGAMVYDKAIDKPIYLDDNKTDWKDATGTIV